LIQSSLWLQKNIGNWLLDGGACETIVHQTQSRSYPYGAFLLKYKFGERLELGALAYQYLCRIYRKVGVDDVALLNALGHRECDGRSVATGDGGNAGDRKAEGLQAEDQAR